MTPTPTDLKNAKEFLDKNLPELKKHNYIVVDIENPKNGYCIDVLLAKHLLHEVAAGRVKFTANREGV